MGCLSTKLSTHASSSVHSRLSSTSTTEDRYSAPPGAYTVVMMRSWSTPYTIRLTTMPEVHQMGCISMSEPPGCVSRQPKSIPQQLCAAPAASELPGPHSLPSRLGLNITSGARSIALIARSRSRLGLLPLSELHASPSPPSATPIEGFAPAVALYRRPFGLKGEAIRARAAAAAAPRSWRRRRQLPTALRRNVNVRGFPCDSLMYP
mmetsp:Transcript_35659/g.89928  ORF Transcript_35659/g.89928 Transcript_35659/m.89928 type:complete len:207 (+) Transcript_35659:1177-1797(+)